MKSSSELVSFMMAFTLIPQKYFLNKSGFVSDYGFKNSIEAITEEELVLHANLTSLLHQLSYGAMLSFVCLLYVIIVPFYSDFNQKWNMVGGYLSFIALHIAFVVVPILSLIMILANTGEILDSTRFPVLILHFMIQLSIVISYF